MDILQALADDAPVKSSRRCKLGGLLDAIPADTPGRAELVATIETRDRNDDNFPFAQTLLVLYRLGLGVSDKTLGEHRRRLCRCFHQ